MCIWAGGWGRNQDCFHRGSNPKPSHIPLTTTTTHDSAFIQLSQSRTPRTTSLSLPSRSSYRHNPGPAVRCQASGVSTCGRRSPAEPRTTVYGESITSSRQTLSGNRRRPQSTLCLCLLTAWDCAAKRRNQRSHNAGFLKSSLIDAIWCLLESQTIQLACCSSCPVSSRLEAH